MVHKDLDGTQCVARSEPKKKAASCLPDAAKEWQTQAGEGRAAVPRASLEPEREDCLVREAGPAPTLLHSAPALRAALGLLFFSFSSFCFFRATKKGMDKQSTNSLLWGSSPWPYAYEAHALPTELKRLLCGMSNFTSCLAQEEDGHTTPKTPPQKSSTTKPQPHQKTPTPLPQKQHRTATKTPQKDTPPQKNTKAPPPQTHHTATKAPPQKHKKTPPQFSTIVGTVRASTLTKVSTIARLTFAAQSKSFAAQSGPVEGFCQFQNLHFTAAVPERPCATHEVMRGLSNPQARSLRPEEEAFYSLVFFSRSLMTIFTDSHHFSRTLGGGLC